MRTQGCTWLSSLFWSSVNRGWCFCMLLRASRSSRSTVSMSLLQKHPFKHPQSHQHASTSNKRRRRDGSKINLSIHSELGPT